MPTLIFGKVFASMFTGSMYGAGAHVFAVMTYVIANMQPNKDRVEYVRLNPKFLAGVIGEDESRIVDAINYLCNEDHQTNSPEDGGRRLVQESPFVYRVVNGRYYRELKDEEDRLQKGAARSQRYRDNKKRSKPLPGESAAVKGLENGTLDENFQPVKPSSWRDQLADADSH